MASVDSTDLIQLIFREKNKSLKIFGIFCFKDLTFYGGDIAGRNPAVGLIRSEAPWSSANSLAAADLVMEWDDRMTLDDIQWKMEIMEIMEITELETWHPPSQIQVDCGHLRKSSNLHPINPSTPFSVKAQMLLPVSTLEVFGAAKDVRNFLANNLGDIQQDLQDIGGYGKDIQRENNLTKIQNRDKKITFFWRVASKSQLF